MRSPKEIQALPARLTSLSRGLPNRLLKMAKSERRVDATVRTLVSAPTEDLWSCDLSRSVLSSICDWISVNITPSNKRLGFERPQMMGIHSKAL